MDRVKGKVAIVTGGAMGIGQACAELLAAEGAAVVVADRERAAGEKVAAAIVAGGRSARFLQLDVSIQDDWRRVVAETVAAFGRLDIVVNNAGVGWFSNVEHGTLEDLHKLFAVNVDGVYLGIQHAIPAMRAAGGGSIINLSSIEGLIGDPESAAYNASKGAVRLLTKSAALYCAKDGSRIRVNSVHPGYIWTPMVQRAVETSAHPAELLKRIEGLHPVGHLGTPMDIAWGVLYLASDESAFVTGAELVIDGGYTAQ